ncbi:MAG: hypothetical protein LBK45_05825 [Tannerellaceae bacterium]|jgi:hypothetical protein|nr:hypothetical protein [Tannerellaceae bacterium]
MKATNLVKKTGRCINFGNCGIADKQEPVEVNLGDDFECPECQGMLVEITKRRPNWILRIIVILGVIGLGVGSYFVLNRNAGSDVAPIPESPISQNDTINDTTSLNPPDIGEDMLSIKRGESVVLSYSGGNGKIFRWYSGSCGGDLVGEGNNLKLIPTETTTYYGRWENGDDEASVCRQITVTVHELEQSEAPSDPPSNPPSPSSSANANAKSYSFGHYAGDLKNGIPEGDGKMTYNKRTQIAKHDTNNPAHYAEAGDYFVGSWGNGDIVSGYLYNKSGGIKERIIAPKRFNPYDLTKD